MVNNHSRIDLKRNCKSLHIYKKCGHGCSQKFIDNVKQRKQLYTQRKAQIFSNSLYDVDKNMLGYGVKYNTQIK